MTETKITHLGHEIVIDDEALTLKIAGKTIDLNRESDGSFSSNYLPYTIYATALDLAKTIVEKAPDFDTTSGR